ncbi:YdeI/OmpD-associated family protein [Isoptericola sp. BMS4]|uniref:YdeI/OmpD-associated family protein n=1 Tax=Isoptericola sp. BMS4 TaxID=2527875 RepID=UPI001423B2DA|nr:YdeI/OmpD-associated family protein [Isoptericola sp. BMS4]
MRFRSTVEPPEKMKGLEVPPEVVEALGGGARPPVVITVNGHTWRSRVAIMRGRHLLGLSRANREAAGLDVGAEVEVELALDTEPRIVVEPDDLAHALDADPVARAAYDALPPGRKRRHVLDVEGAKQPATRARRIEKTLAALRG